MGCDREAAEPAACLGDGGNDPDGYDVRQCTDVCFSGVEDKAVTMSTPAEHLARIVLETDAIFDHGHLKRPDEYVAVEDVKIAADKVQEAMDKLETAVMKAKEIFKRDKDL